jgi:predicted cobalt transporter CbtA
MPVVVIVVVALMVVALDIDEIEGDKTGWRRGRAWGTGHGNFAG